MTAKEIFDLLNEADEQTHIEAKSGGEISTSVMETICAFSNEPGLGGGFILLGAKEDNYSLFPQYVVNEVVNPEKLQSELASKCSSMFNIPIRPRIKIDKINDKFVAVIQVEELPQNQKPLFFRSENLPRGAYRRIGPTDHRCTEDDLPIFYSDSNTYDQSPLNNTSINDIDEVALSRYRDLRMKLNSAAEELTYNDQELKIMGTKKAGEPLPWTEWGEEFSTNLPLEIIEALKSAIETSSGTLEDSKWRQKLAERFGKRWNQRLNRLSEKGLNQTHPNQNLNLFEELEAPQRKGPRAKRNVLMQAKRDDLKDNAGTTATAEQKAKETNAPRGIPDYRWVRKGELEEGVAAAWEKPNSLEPSGVVLLNRDFEMFDEVVDYWKNQYPDHYADKIEEVIQEVYGQAMVARIAHSESFTRNKIWGRSRVESELRSPSSLTMAVLGLVTEDHIIANKLGSLLSKRQTN